MKKKSFISVLNWNRILGSGLTKKESKLRFRGNGNFSQDQNLKFPISIIYKKNPSFWREIYFCCQLLTDWVHTFCQLITGGF